MDINDFIAGIKLINEENQLKLIAKNKDNLHNFSFAKHKDSWKALWLLNKYQVTVVKVYIAQLFDLLISGNQSIIRESLKALRQIELQEKWHSKLLDAAIKIWNNANNISSCRYYAGLILLELTEQYPELKQEVNFLFHDEIINSLSPGIKKSILKKLNALN